MGDKRFSEVVNWDEHIKPYRVIQFIAGVGSGKNYWVEEVLMQKKKVLLVTSRKSKVGETSVRLGIGTCLNLNKLADDEIEYLFSGEREFGSCVCNNSQIEYYIRNRFNPGDKKTYIWQYFDLIVIDEDHSLATDALYSDAPFYVHEFIKATYRYSKLKTVLMTATFNPIKNMIRLKKPSDYKLWDFRSECINIEPNELLIIGRDHLLSIMASTYKNHPDGKWHIIYFATRTSSIKNHILPLLVGSGIPEENIAVSFSRKDAEDGFSATILKNKERVEEYLENHEDIPEDIKVFITTSKNKEGINIDNKDFAWHIAIESHWKDEAQQMWGRVRSPIDKVFLIYDAPQHMTHSIYNDFDSVFDYTHLAEINDAFNKWCNKNDLPEDNRYQNERVRKKIDELQERKFPYLRYSICDDRFCTYKGKVEGELCFEKSVNEVEGFLHSITQEGPIPMDAANPFSMEAYLIQAPCYEDMFINYISTRGYLDGVPLSKQDQKELLVYISDTLMVRQQSNSTLKYNILAKALSIFGYTTKECSHHKNSPLYGYVRLEKIKKDEGEDFDLLI